MFARFSCIAPLGWLSSLLGLLLVAPARAVITVTTSAGAGEPRFVLADGATPVPNGVQYQVGTFPEGTDLSAAGGTPSAWYASWQEFARDVVYTNPTTLEAGSAGEDLVGLDYFAAKPAYWWVLLTSDGMAVAGDFSNVVQQALFRGVSPAWQFPATPGVGVPPVLSTADSLSFTAGSLVDGEIQLALVPEPTSGLLALLGGAVLLRRRRQEGASSAILSK